MNFFDKLEKKGIFFNDEQKKAITYINGPLLVVAGPGSGKTNVIAARTAYMIKSGIDPSKILVITFTKAAANEMRERFKSFPDINSCTVNKVDFGTFHSIFYKIINTYYGRRISVLDEYKAASIIKKILKSINEPYDDELTQNILNEISIVRITEQNINEYNPEYLSLQKFIYIFNQYETHKRYLKCIDFDDMLILCKKLLESDINLLSYWKKKYKYFMVDEFQDSNRLQFEIVKLLCSPLNNICAVGDDDQSIYSFRGALPDCLINFERCFKYCKTITLNINYRSTDEIIELSKKIISHNSLRKPKSLKSIKGSGLKPAVLLFQDKYIEALNIVNTIENMMMEGYSYNDFAVLYRTNIQSRPFIDEFIKRDIPFNVKDSINNFFDHWTCRDITSYLKLSINNDDYQSFMQIINKPVRYISKDVLNQIYFNRKDKNFDLFNSFKNAVLKEFQRKNITELFLNIKLLKNMTPNEAIKYIRKTIGYDEYILKYCSDINLNPTELFDILDEYEESSSGFKTIAQFLFHIQEVSKKLDQNKKNYNYKKDSVTLSTIHGAKGLEFTCVFVTGLVEGCLPHAKNLKTALSIEEERRLFYVAVTRAKQYLYISYFKNQRGNSVKASRFIEELNDDHVPKKQNFLNLFMPSLFKNDKNLTTKTVK